MRGSLVLASGTVTICLVVSRSAAMRVAQIAKVAAA